MDIITYESIRAAHRAEKNEQLAKLPEGFWPAVRSWISGKEDRKDSTSLLEADSAKKLVEDIVQRRQRKIVVSALATARGAVPPTGLTVEEARLFDQLVAAIRVAGRNALETAIGADAIAREKIEEAKRSVEELHVQGSGQESKTVSNTSQMATSQTKMQASVEDALKATAVKVRLLTALPAVVGLDKQTYGPFDIGATTELPQDIANVLHARGAIEMLT